MTEIVPVTQAGEPTLLPCPFCGGEAERYTAAIGRGFENRQVQCRSCGASAFDLKWQVRLSSQEPAPRAEEVEEAHARITDWAQKQPLDSPAWDLRHEDFAALAAASLSRPPRLAVEEDAHSARPLPTREEVDLLAVGRAIEAAWNGSGSDGKRNDLPPIDLTEQECRHIGSAAVAALLQTGGGR